MSQENERASELNHSEKVGGMASPASADTGVVLQPGSVEVSALLFQTPFSKDHGMPLIR